MIRTLLLLLIPATAFLYYPLAFEEFETPKAYSLVTFGCIAFCYAKWKLLLKDKIAQAIALFAVSAAVSTALSIDIHMSLFGNAKCPMGLFVIVSYLVLYLIAVETFQNKRTANEVQNIILACAGIVASYGIAQAFGYDFKSWNGTLHDGPYTRPMSTLGHPNFMANYLAMILPLGLYRLECSKSWIKALYSCLILLIIAAIYMSLSRGMIIASCVGILVYYSNRYKKAAKFFGIWAIIATLIFFLAPRFKADATTRLEALVSPGAARKEYPKGAFRIWKKSPWFGVGTDAFELAFRNQRNDYYWQIERGGSPHKAHNDFFNILATQGLFGAICAILFTAAIVGLALKARSQLEMALISGIVVFYVAGITSFVIVSTGTVLMVYLGMLQDSIE